MRSSVLAIRRLIVETHLLQGARVWIPDSEQVWAGAVLLEDWKGQGTLAVETEDTAEVIDA